MKHRRIILLMGTHFEQSTDPLTGLLNPTVSMTSRWFGVFFAGWMVFGTTTYAVEPAPLAAPDASLRSLVPVPLSVNTVHPRSGNDLVMPIEQPADVAPYYRAALYSEVSGVVTFLEKDIGHPVTQDEKIAVIKPSDKGSPHILTSPFDGVIASRSVDPGTFVASAAIVPGAPAIVTLERNDIVTLSSRMPDRVSSLINKGTEAELYFNALPGGVPLRAHISRLAPSLSVTDRTIRVEIDLYNRNETAFREFMIRSESKQHEDLKGREPPQFPTGLQGDQSVQLIPGSYGRMRLLVRPGQNSALLPASAVSRRGGVAYVFRVDKGTVQKIRVDIELEDEHFARVLLHGDQGDAVNRRQPLQTEEFVTSNLGELENGQAITPILSSW